jgi:hypothetical protein
MVGVMLDDDLADDFLKLIADRYTPDEIVELLGLTEWDIIEAFRDKILESPDGTFNV